MASKNESLNRLRKFRATIEANDVLLAQETYSSTGVVTEANFGDRTLDFEIERI